MRHKNRAINNMVIINYILIQILGSHKYSVLLHSIIWDLNYFEIQFILCNEYSGIIIYHLRWSWHWFSLTENFWTWLSETRSRGGARRAAGFFFWKPRKTWIFRFLARKAGKICSKFFIAFGRKKTLKNFAPKKRILTRFWKNIEKMLTKSGVFIVRLQFEWMNVSKSVGNS